VTLRIDGPAYGGISLKLKLKFIFKIVDRSAARSAMSVKRGGGDPSLRLKYGYAQDDAGDIVESDFSVGNS
jgi:hypothetical protein